MEITFLQKIASLLNGTIQWKMFNTTICNKKNHAIITLKNQLFVINVTKKTTLKNCLIFKFKKPCLKTKNIISH